MRRLMMLELRRTSLRPYWRAACWIALGLLAAYALMGAIPAVSASQGEPLDPADLELVGSWPGLIRMNAVLSMVCFSVFSAVLGDRLVAREYRGRRAVLLLSYPTSRRAVVWAKCGLVFGVTAVACLAATLGCFCAFALAAVPLGLLPQALTAGDVGALAVSALPMSVLAASVGLLAARAGFWKRSTAAAVVTSLLLVSLCSNLLVAVADPGVLLAFTGLFLAAALLACGSLANAAEAMEAL